MHDNLSIILAAGEGKRMGLVEQNKTTLTFSGKPIVAWGVDKLLTVSKYVIVVVGKNKDSVIDSLSQYDDRVIFAEQLERKGTGHAVKIALDTYPNLSKDVKNIIVGYGDHMMFYKSASISKLVHDRMIEDVAMSMVTTKSKDISSHAWGRIIRDQDGYVQAIVEQKNCTKEELLIDEGNAGLYCFKTRFLLENIDKIILNPLSGEYYLTDLVELAVKKGEKVVATELDYSEVGAGVNSPADWEEVRLMTS